MSKFLLYFKVLFGFSAPFQNIAAVSGTHSLTQQTFVSIICYVTNIGNSKEHCQTRHVGLTGHTTPEWQVQGIRGERVRA